MEGKHLSRTLASLIEGLSVDLVRGGPATIIDAIVEDSRCVEPGTLFVARRGLSTDGRAFIDDAVARGAAAVVTAQAATIGPMAERFHGEPSRKLALVGVTGTNGKTTVTHLVQHVLDRAGMRCGLMGTVKIDDGGEPEPADMTTPPAVEISRRLAAMVTNGCAAAAIEVSSHALHQGRTAGLSFDVGVFTNLSGDHLDYHPSLESYADAKATLFAGLTAEGFAVINIDDDASGRMIDGCPARLLGCSLEDRQAECIAVWLCIRRLLLPTTHLQKRLWKDPR